MRNRRRVHNSLMINYVLFSVILGVIGFVVYDNMYDAREEYISRTLPRVEANLLIRDDWESIPYETVQSFGGYIQVLDKSLNVVFSRGSGMEKAKACYTEEELLALFYEGNGSGYHSLAPFVSPEGREYHLLVTIPGGVVMKESHLVKTNAEITKVFTRFLIDGFLWFAAAFLLSLWLYGRITARRITNPLTEVSANSHRLQKAGEGNGYFFEPTRS